MHHPPLDPQALAGKLAAVTGAGGGLGRSISRLLADAAADVTLIGRSPEYLKQAAPRAEAITQEVRDTVSEILRSVERDGEAGVRQWSKRLDDWSPESFRVSAEEIAQVRERLDPALGGHIDDALEQVRTFAKAQRGTTTDLETTRCREHARPSSSPARRCGLVFARWPVSARCLLDHECRRFQGGRGAPWRARRLGTRTAIHPPQLHAMAASGADEVFCSGGVQALAAMAFGIDGLDPVDMIAGPGNAYVAEAKKHFSVPWESM